MSDPRARKLDYLPLTTLDGDVAVPPKLKKEESTVRKRLLEAGFQEEFVEGDRPAATHYRYRKGGGLYDRGVLGDDGRIAKAFRNNVAPKLHPRRIAELERSAWTLFDKVTDTIREAALIAGARKLNPERLSETSRAGLNEIFGLKVFAQANKQAVARVKDPLLRHAAGIKRAAPKASASGILLTAKRVQTCLFRVSTRSKTRP